MPEPDWVPMRAVDWSSWENQMQTPSLPQAVDAPDPVAIAAMEKHLQSLAALGMPPGEQGLWIQSGNEVLASHQGTVPISAASLTKIPTTLAALSVWGHEHHFETLVGMRGTLQPDGLLQGDLVVQGGGDPLLVWEEAIALGNALQEIGIREVTGDLLITGDFYMNFEADPAQSGEWLRQSFNADRWNGEARAQYARMPDDTPQPRIAIDGTVQVVSQRPNDVTPIIRHQSLSLTQILKAMNIFSNNFIADNLAGQMGGGRRVAQIAAEAAAVPLEEVQLINGSGLGEENRLSPRAVTAMLMALQIRLQAVDLTVADFFPVVGRERGTLGDRQLLPGSALKTGTLDRVSSLAGVVPTRDRPLVWFSLMDIGTADLGTLHRQQDQLLQALATAWGITPDVPAGLQPSDQLPGYQEELGNPARNEAL
ncbi:D-alanyl-D-alanine carboxypeptidase [Vacuolonema iberomarrocanum]|uniref:D-alanyl-D-alanine carboxypeptidase n=1 Tax=Vacuolonema iberomarrocanum TaxID=3454632 RepID=UPI0019E515F5|nr:D-alanyl-D-alanine carboxypeptidase [filamentous cyanobacterium LEGE 07170]